MSDLTQNIKFLYENDDSSGEFEVRPVPIGADETEQTIKRSKKTDGMVLNIVQNVKFVKEPFRLITRAFEKWGVDMLFKIVKKEKYFNDFLPIHSAYLLGSTLEWDKTTATADFVDSSFDAVLRDNINEKFELDRLTDINGDAIDALVRSQMTWKPRNIFLKTYLELESGTPDSGGAVPEFIVTPKVEMVNNSDTTIVSVLDSSVFSAAYTGDVSAANAFLLDNDRFKTLNIDFKANITTTDYSNYQVRLYKYSGIPFSALVSETNIGSLTSGANTFDVDESFTVDVEIGESLVLGVWIDLDTPPFSFEVTANTASINVEEDSFFEPERSEDTVIDVIPIKDAFTRMVEILDPAVTFESEFLDNNWPDLVITGGETIRHVTFIEDEVETIAPLLTTSLEKLYKFVYAIQPVAYTLLTENGKTTLRLEEIGYVFDREEAVNLGSVTVENYKVNNERTYSSVRVGWTKSGENEEVYSLQAFNTSTIYQLPSKGDNEYDATSDFIPDPNWAELIYRKQNAQFPDISHKNDNDIFVFDCYKIKNRYRLYEYTTHFSSVTGIYDPSSAYNLRLSPINCAIRHAKNFKQEYTKPVYVGKSMVYSSSEGNVNLKTTLTGESELHEGGEVLLSAMDDPMYTNKTIDVYLPFTKAKRDLINLDTGKPNYLKTFLWTDENGNNEKAFAYDIAIKQDKITVELAERYR